MSPITGVWRPFVGGLAAVLFLCGCGTPPWQEAGIAVPGSSSPGGASPSPAGAPRPEETPLPWPLNMLPPLPKEREEAKGPARTPSAPPSPTPTPTPEPTPEPAPPMVVDDLASGRADRTFAAGAFAVTAQYWSTRGKPDWTPAAVKPLTINVSAVGAKDLALTGLSVNVERLTPHGWVAVGPGVVSPVELGPSAPHISAPGSASTTVMVGSIEPDSHALRYTLAFSISSGRNQRTQTSGTDSLVVTLVPGT
ncbi:MAG: hypothetical protein Q4F65_11445 [Propionibacteriaceae bacterium]|nr:hypothetical protein [Propionibacteriaceae bacterium]